MHEISKPISAKNKKNIINFPSAEFAHSIVKVCASYLKCATLNLNHSLGKFSRQQIGDIFLFSQKTVFDISCKFSFCMKCQILFPGKNKKKYFKYRLLKILSEY